MKLFLFEYFAIVLFSSICAFLFLNSFFSQAGFELNFLLLLFSCIAFYFVLWFLYSFAVSKISKTAFLENLKKDSFVYLFSILFLLFFLMPKIESVQVWGIEQSSFGLILFAKLLLVMVFSLIVFFKVLNLPKTVFEKAHSRKIGLNAFHLTIISIIVFFIVFLSMIFFDFFAFQVPAPDLWIFNQSLWSSLHGNLLYSSRVGMNYFAHHFAPVLLLLIPFYALWQSPLNLLVIQTIFISIGTLPVFLIARKTFDCKFAGFVFAFSYLLFPALNFIALREFHSIALTIPLLLFAFYFLQENKLKYFLFFILFSLIVEETVSLVLFFFGLYIFFAKKNKKLGAAVSALSIAWFLLAVFAFIPFFSGGIPYQHLSGSSNPFSSFGQSPGEIAKNVLFNPALLIKEIFTVAKMGYLLLLFLPLLFLSLLGLPVLLIAFPVFAQNLLSNIPTQASIYFQYNSLIIPFLFISAIFGLKRFLEWFHSFADSKTLMRSALFAILASSFFSAVFFGPCPLSLLDPFPTQSNFNLNDYTITEHHQLLWQAIELIPANAAVSADSMLLTQISSRKELNYFPENLDKAEFIFLDQSVEFHESAKNKGLVQKILKTGDYEIIFNQDNILLLKKLS